MWASGTSLGVKGARAGVPGTEGSRGPQKPAGLAWYEGSSRSGVLRWRKADSGRGAGPRPWGVGLGGGRESLRPLLLRTQGAARGACLESGAPGAGDVSWDVWSLARGRGVAAGEEAEVKETEKG